MNDKTIPRLTSRERKYKDAEFFEEVITILRDEGYSRHWKDLRRKLHKLLDRCEKAGESHE
ncbi:hypothetical protein [Paenibacillus vini]|uniref:Uncharacterized protein n=1 Tax=Paenibacillus vini TaxID=1476024 RepID=A0ABQ4MIV9_9BACL|nr:hypothetical protein [Paenibacillus vini]GIP55927.1 hypothetical protein J42TS3_49620 [Paenibacillus vini]